MEDSLSVKSNESLATSDEYDFVSDKPGMSKTPTLDIGGNGDINELKNALSEVLEEPEYNNMNQLIEDKAKKVGQSQFYNYPVYNTEATRSNIGSGGGVAEQLKRNNVKVSPTEKQDIMKPEDFSDESENFTPTDFDEEGKAN